MAEAREPDPKRFFKKLVCDNSSKMMITHTDIELRFLDSETRPEEFFRKHPQYFVLFQNNTGRVTMVGARLPGILQGVSQWWEPGYQVYYRACHNGGSQIKRYRYL